MRNLDNCLVFCILFGAVACYYPARWPIRFPSSGLRITSPFYRSLRQSRFPSYRSFGRVLSPRSSFNPFGRTRSFSNFNDFNNNNNNNNNDWNNNDDRLSSFLGGARRGIGLTGSRIIPQRIRTPLRLQRGRVSSIPLRPRITTRRRLPYMQSSRPFRVPSRRISRGRLSGRQSAGIRRLSGRQSTGIRRVSGRQSTGIRRPNDQVLAILAFDNHHHETAGHPAIGSHVKDGADLNLNIDNELNIDAPVSAEFAAQSPDIKRLRIKSESVSVIGPNSSGDVVKAKSLDTQVSAKSDIKISDADTVNILTSAVVQSGNNATATVEAAQVDKRKRKIETIVAHATDKKIKVTLPVVDSKDKMAVKKSITERVSTIHGATVVKDAPITIVSAADVTAKSDIKISDADTVNSLTSTVVQSGNNGTATVEAAHVDTKKRKIKTIVAHATENKIKVTLPVVDSKKKMVVKKSITVGGNAIHGATIVKDTPITIVPAADVTAKASAKSDIKISDADTVNILTSTVVQSGNNRTAIVEAAHVDKKAIGVDINKNKKDANIIIA